MQSEQPVALQTTYDSADAALQWRCNLHFLLKPENLVVFAVLATAMTFMLNPSLLHFLAIFATLVGLGVGEIALTTQRRCRSQRLCTSTINENGVHDLTPDGGITYAWREIVKIEETEGDIYFFTRIGGMFVPRSAFADLNQAQEFYRTAVNFWQSGRSPLLSASTAPTGSTAITPDKAGDPQLSKEDQLAKLLAEDEAVWEALEKEHKKQKENQNNS
ncbi:MAG: YcxB family protein [Cyanobacteria bacterium SZAS TMP-1]|nr:YcxB family protein [Cyanobacteria bacterium SZAS TMP-1]